MLVLAVGDLHIPNRATDIPEKLLAPGKISQVICLGNLTDKATTEFIQGIAPDYQAVKGEYDTNTSLPLNRVVSHGQFRIGFVSGHSVIPNSDPDALLIVARQLDVDLLIWGGSHRVEAYELEGKFFISPGSATGAFCTNWPEDEEEEEDENEEEENGDENDHKDNLNSNRNSGKKSDDKDDASNDSKTTTKQFKYDNIPSFCLLDIQGALCIIYIYSLVNGQVKVDKVSYRKD